MSAVEPPPVAVKMGLVQRLPRLCLAHKFEAFTSAFLPTRRRCRARAFASRPGQGCGEAAPAQPARSGLDAAKRERTIRKPEEAIAVRHDAHRPAVSCGAALRWRKRRESRSSQ